MQNIPKDRNARQPRSAKARGRPNDPPMVRLSKTLSYILRHGANSEGVVIRQDGYVRVSDLLANPRLQSLDFVMLQEIVKSDAKGRYDLVYEGQTTSTSTGDLQQMDATLWWIRANQGHSMKTIQLDLKPVLSGAELPMAVHGTNLRAWESIRKHGLSKMNRNHIHLAQGIPGDNVISGMRTSSSVFIYIDIDKAISAGIGFFLSANGVVLTEGDERGYLKPQFFSKVENAQREPMHGWEDISTSPSWT